MTPCCTKAKSRGKGRPRPRLRRATGSPRSWLGAFVLAGVALGGCHGEGRRPPPNLVLVSIDTLNRSALRAYSPDAPLLPTLDAFAADSVRFDRALSTASWTLPAHGSLLTGLYPDRHGATDRRVVLAAEAPRLARALREAGYETIAFTGGGYLGAEYGFDAGFDRYDDRAPEGAPPPLALPRDGAPSLSPGSQLFDRAIAYLRARDPRAPPFFLFLHTYAVHHYYEASPWAAGRLPAFDDLAPRDYLDCLRGWASCRPEVFQRLERLYRSEVAHLDRVLRDLLWALRDAGITERTVVALLSDHGEGFDAARIRIHHGGRLHADQLRIPLLLRIPGTAPRVVAEPVSIVDVMPTLLELAGARPPERLDGRSLLPLLREGGAAPGRPLFAMEHFYGWRKGERRGSAEILARPLALAAVRDRLWYILDANGEQLYDVDRDPAQERNLLAGRLRRAGLERLRGAVRSRLRDRPETPRVEGSPALEQQLRALGYVD